MARSVSIIIPVYNSEDTIARCVQSALEQASDARVEVVVIDNGSTDRTREIVQSFPVKCLHESRRGRSAARNRGVRETSGEFLAFLDSDCVAPRSWLQASLAALDRDWIGAVQARIRKHGQAAPPRSFIQGHYFVPFLDTAGLVTTRTAFQHTRGFDEELSRNVDMDFTFRLLASGYALAWCPDTLIVKYHYLDSRHAWRRGLEGGTAGSQIEAKWASLLGNKPRRRRYKDRLSSVSKSTLRALLEPQPQPHLVATEQLGRLVAYVGHEAKGAPVTRHDYECVTRVPAVLGARRFLLLHGAESTIFDAERERQVSLDAAATLALRETIDGVAAPGATSVWKPMLEL